MSMVIVLVRGLRNVRQPVKDGLKQLGLTRRFHATLVNDETKIKGLLIKAQHWLAWGPASDATVNALQAKGKSPYRLHPPHKGMPPVKLRYPKGAHGNWGESINDLIVSMMA
jgi:ribosomal protein L30/L7E